MDRFLVGVTLWSAATALVWGMVALAWSSWRYR